LADEPLQAPELGVGLLELVLELVRVCVQASFGLLGSHEESLNARKLARRFELSFEVLAPFRINRKNARNVDRRRDCRRRRKRKNTSTSERGRKSLAVQNENRAPVSNLAARGNRETREPLPNHALGSSETASRIGNGEKKRRALGHETRRTLRRLRFQTIETHELVALELAEPRGPRGPEVGTSRLEEPTRRLVGPTARRRRRSDLALIRA
jgi:hypothetical protein